MRPAIVFLAVALFAGGCAHYPVNAPLAAVDARTGYRFQNTASPTNSPELLLMLAFSGGGTRAATVAYGVLEELGRTGVGPPGEQHRLLDEVDLIKSDLSRFTIGRAVAASSAFPVLLSPIVLKNHSAGRQSPEPEWIRLALTDRAASSRLRNLALQARSYLDGDRRRYIHLLDGGITDNLGLRGAVDRAIVHESTAGRLPTLALEKARRIAIIIVDAQAARDYGWDSQERTPRLRDLVGSIGQVPIDRYSFETIELFRESAARLAREVEAARRETGAEAPAALTFYTVELHFSQLADDSERDFFNSVPTRLQLPSSTVDRLRRLAPQQLAHNEEFRR